MTKVASANLPVINQNLKGVKPFRGSNAKIPSNTANEEIQKPMITEQSKNLKTAKENTPTSQSEAPDTKNMLTKAGNVASAIAKTPILPVIIPSSPEKIESKISDNKIEKKPEAPQHYIKKPAVIFIEGFSAFGISNGDGINEMAENFPGARKFNWTDHDDIIGEIKKHAPNQPVILVGHSFGGDTAIEVAHELNSAKNGFRSIDLIVSIDAVGMNKSIIPINVKSNLNFFGEGIVPFIHGDPTVARNTKYTEVSNELRNDLHSRMEDNPDVQFQIFQKINEVLGASGKEDIFIEISETNQIKNILEAIKDNL